jgi:hypothetical protein
LCSPSFANIIHSGGGGRYGVAEILAQLRQETMGGLYSSCALFQHTNRTPVAENQEVKLRSRDLSFTLAKCLYLILAWMGGRGATKREVLRRVLARLR